jgi:Fic family protein
MDGNGRTARAILDWILERSNYKLQEFSDFLLNVRKVTREEVARFIKEHSTKL